MMRRVTIMRRSMPPWLLPLLAACSPDPAKNEAESAPAAAPESETAPTSEELPLTFDGKRVADLTREEIWALGVEHLHWHPEEAPAEWTKEMMLERFWVDLRFKDYEDSEGYF